MDDLTNPYLDEAFIRSLVTAKPRQNYLLSAYVRVARAHGADDLPYDGITAELMNGSLLTYKSAITAQMNKPSILLAEMNKSNVLKSGQTVKLYVSGILD
jgi:hypothetical protein